MGHFQVVFILYFKARSGAFDMKMSFICQWKKTHFHMKGFTLSLTLKQRLKATWKWPICRVRWPTLSGFHRTPLSYLEHWFVVLKEHALKLDDDTTLEKQLTNFSVTGNSNSFTNPKSSPVARERPLDDRLAQLTSALSAFRGHTPITSLPRTLKCRTVKNV